jgi:hypothetical protein
MTHLLHELIDRWRTDQGGTYRTWFLWEERSGAVQGLFLVAPDSREEEVRAQLRRPAFRRVADLNVRYLPYGELERHRDAIGRFGAGLKAINAIAKTLF